MDFWNFMQRTVLEKYHVLYKILLNSLWMEQNRRISLATQDFRRVQLMDLKLLSVKTFQLASSSSICASKQRKRLFKRLEKLTFVLGLQYLPPYLSCFMPSMVNNRFVRWHLTMIFWRLLLVIMCFICISVRNKVRPLTVFMKHNSCSQIYQGAKSLCYG